MGSICERPLLFHRLKCSSQKSGPCGGLGCIGVARDQGGSDSSRELCSDWDGKNLALTMRLAILI